MNEPVQAADLAKVMALPKLKKVDLGAGEAVSPLGLDLTWKIKGADTGYAFAVYEMVLKPGSGIPLHVHPSAEFFYVLEGGIDVMGLDANGAPEWTRVSAGEGANAPPTAPHGIMNRGDEPAKFLSISNYHHESFFNEYCAIVDAAPAGTMSEQEQVETFMRVAYKAQAHPLVVSE